MTRIVPASPGPGWDRPTTWIAIALLAASLAMVAFSLASLVLPGSAALPDRPDLISFLTTLSMFVALPTVGAILAILRPRNPIGWLFLVSGAGFILGIFSTEYVGRALDAGANLPAVELVDWMGAWAWTLSFGLAVIWIPMLFPDGHLPGPRWRPFGWFAAVVVVTVTVSAAVTPDAQSGYTGRLANPLGVGGPIGTVAAAVNTVGLPLAAVLCLVSFASLVVRFRRAREVERQQLKWFLFAAGFLFIAIIAAVATQALVTWYALELGVAALPVAAGLAVLRYRLYEIDRIISRTVSYAIVSGLLVAVFAGVILLLQGVLAPVHAGPDDRRRGLDAGRLCRVPAAPATRPDGRRPAVQSRRATTPNGRSRRSRRGCGTTSISPASIRMSALCWNRRSLRPASASGCALGR